MSFGKNANCKWIFRKKNFRKEFFYDLDVGFSKDVCLLQIANHPKPMQMFHKNYPFYTR